MTSTVTAKTRSSLAEIFSAHFPSASITGAPKVGTMRIISEIETTPRRIYTGSIGYISPQRKAKFNVAIRTALIDRETQKAEYGVVVALFGIPPVRTNMQKPCSKPEC